jgi:hypothetical protein
VVAGTLLYYVRAVTTTILTALSLIATEKAKPMQEMMKKMKQLLDYCVICHSRGCDHNIQCKKNDKHSCAVDKDGSTIMPLPPYFLAQNLGSWQISWVTVGLQMMSGWNG